MTAREQLRDRNTSMGIGFKIYKWLSFANEIFLENLELQGWVFVYEAHKALDFWGCAKVIIAHFV